MKPERVQLPTGNEPARGWCLYQDDRWFGPSPQEEDRGGFIVHASEASAYAALAAEMRLRCDAFDDGKLSGGELRCQWFPMPVSLYRDGHILDETNSEHYPKCNQGS